MQRESMGGEGITASSSDAASKAFSQAMSYASMSNMHYSSSSAGPVHIQQSQSQAPQLDPSGNDLTNPVMYQQHQLMNSAAAVMNTSAITCLVCYNAQVNIMLEPCRHQFHVHCIDRWLNKDKVCPVCWIPIQNHRPIVPQFPSTPQASSGSTTHGTNAYTTNPNASTTTTNATTTNNSNATHANTQSTNTNGGGMLSGPAAASILPAQAAANMEHPNPPSMRKGKWTTEESAFCDRLIEEFKKGNLPLAEGTTLRTFLSKLLNCDPMRISKKYTGDQCIGKIIFRRREDELTKDEMEMIRRDLAELEKTYLEREQYNQRRREKRLESELSRDKNRFLAATRNASATTTLNAPPAANSNAMAAFNAAAAAVSAMRPPQQPQQPPPSTMPSAASSMASQQAHEHQQRQLQQQQQHQQQQAYQTQLAAQQRQQMIAQAQAQAHARAQAQSMAPPRHPPAQQSQQQQQQQQQQQHIQPQQSQQHGYGPLPPSSRPLKDEFASSAEPVASSAPSTTSSSESMAANSLSMSRVSSIDSFGCMFPRVASVDGFGSHANDASAASGGHTLDAGSSGLVKSFSIGDGLSAYFPRIQSLEHLSSLLQEHAPASPRNGLSRLNITVKDEIQNGSGEDPASSNSGNANPDADPTKRLSPPTSHLAHARPPSFADPANQIQVPKPLSKMPRSSSGIFPRVPSMDKLPRVPSMDKLPRIPSMDKLHNLERAPSLSKLPRVPSLDKNLSRISSSSDMLLGSFPSFSNLANLAPSASFDKLSALAHGNLSMFGVHGNHGGGGHGAGFRGSGFPRNSSIEDILSLVASSESSGVGGSNSSLQLSALAVLAGEEAAANDRKRRREGTDAGSGSGSGSGSSGPDALDPKKNRVSA